MKNIFTIVLISLMLTFSFNANAAVNYGLDHDCGTASLVVTVTSDVAYPASNWTPYVVTISWPVALGPAIMGAVTNTAAGFSYAPAGVVGTDGVFYYQKYAGIGTGALVMTASTTYEVFRIALGGVSGTIGSFTIPDNTNAWVTTNNGFSVFSDAGGNQHPGVYAAVTDPFVPVGPGIYFDTGTWCGGAQANGEPSNTDGTLDCFIQSPGATITYFNGAVNNLNILPGADLTIAPGFALTANGATFINDPSGLKITANATGSGSFIDNGTVTYGAGGSATVQTHIVNNLGGGSFHMHQIGPTVMDPTFPGSFPGTGVFLSAFNIFPTSTYAYRYDEPTASWMNIFLNTDPVPTGAGIGFSGTTTTPGLLSMTGLLATAPVSTTAVAPYIPSVALDGWNLFSNPFASCMSIGGPNGFYLTNQATFGFNTYFYVWEGAPINNYASYDGFFGSATGGLAATGGVINPGQGFFGQIGAPATLTFPQLSRTHMHTPFLKEEMQNIRLTAQGNMSQDEVLIRFAEGATFAYDDLGDGYKWESAVEEATQIRTIASDQSELTVNSIPLLGAEMVTIPMHFDCGAADSYTITASEMETLEPGTEVYLEDLVTGDAWHNLTQNAVYTFAGSPDDPSERFLIHFFGPTGIDEPLAEEPIKIYSNQQYAYILNDGSEEIEEFVVYNMMGREILRGTLPNNSLNKVFVGQTTAYFVVEVITKNRVFNQKVLITR